MTVIGAKEKPGCPEARKGWYNDMDICKESGRLCVLESGEECPIYNEYLEEETK